MIQNEVLTYVGLNKKKISIKITQISESSDEIRNKYNNVNAFMKKIKKTKENSKESIP